MRLYFIFLLSIILLVLPVESLFESEYQLGKVRLTSDGTTYFKSFENDKVKVKEFFDNLTQELAKAIPVGPERITTNRRHEIDTSVSSEQYVLSIDIKMTNNKTERNASLIVSDLDTLIKNKLTTVIGSGDYTNYLDGQYGYQIIPRWIEKNLSNVLASIALNIVLLMLAFQNNTFTIYSRGNAIVRFVSSILFTSIDAGSVENVCITSLFFVAYSFTINLGFAYKIVSDELMRHGLQKLLEELEDDLKEGNNPAEYESVEDGGTTELIINNNGVDRLDKITKVLREIKRELRIIFGELIVISELIKELKTVNENLKNPKVIVKKLNKINKFIREFMQVEGFTKELLDVSEHLDKLDELLKEIKDNVNEKEISEINYLIESMKNKLRIEQLKKKLNEAAEYLTNNEVILASEDSEKIKELLKELNDFKKELREFNDRAEPTAVDEDEEMNNAVNEYSDEKNILDLFLRKFESRFGSLRESDQPEKKYRKISQWLRDYKDNQVIVVIFAILAGVDLLHIKLLGSMLRVPIPSLNFFCLKPKIIAVDFNAKLSYAAKRNLFWGVVCNIFNMDIPAIFLQEFDQSIQINE
ncbi:hypothetical protein RhiirA4_494158 [Rhizophagus irregularis]|uniref:Uncharacterized protein n=1 Tax=Rhizophagus irregularis TaxID=588596 RepID=A0A2I1GYD3_9GLOM|nr:hypothetical protein RhiirA4_494158 [Rhizophagus irregularis]